MKKIESTICDNCGAKLGARPGPGLYRCEYCGHEYRIVAGRPSEVGRRPGPGAPARPGPARLIALVGVILVLLIGGAASFLALRTSGDQTGQLVASTGQRASGTRAATGASAAIRAERVLWDKVGGLPRVAVVGGKEVVIGRLRSMQDQQLSIAAIDSASLQEVWRTPGLGTYSEGYRWTHFAVTGDRVVVTDHRSVVRLLDLESGKVLKDLPLTDRVQQICGPLADDHLWLELIDKRSLLLDVKTARTREARARPRQCPRRQRRTSHSGYSFARKKAPRVEGFRPLRVHLAGDLAVASGVKSPGTALPLAVGFSPRDRQVRWNVRLASADATSVRERSNVHDDLAGGRFVSVYGVGSSKGWHVVALDATTGDQLWDVALRDIFAVDWIHGLVLSPSYVYILRSSSLEVRRAQTGALVGTVGYTNYAR